MCYFIIVIMFLFILIIDILGALYTKYPIFKYKACLMEISVNPNSKSHTILNLKNLSKPRLIRKYLQLPIFYT